MLARIAYRTGCDLTVVAITNRRNFADDGIAMENTINCDVHPDGKRLAIVVRLDEGSQLNVIVNWTEELKRSLKQ